MSAGESEGDQMETVGGEADAYSAEDVQVGGSRFFNTRRENKSYGLDGRIRMEGSRRFARESRERQKLHYRTLEHLVASRERKVQMLRRELEEFKKLCTELDQGRVPQEILDLISSHKSA